MNDKKEKLLNDTYQKWIHTSLYDLPLDAINDFVDPKIMGYGTAIDEKVLSVSDYRKLINTQREQSVGLDMSFEITPVFRSISKKEDSAIFVDEINVSIIVNENKQGLFLRLTTILDYIDSKWIVVHWHGSMPTETTGQSDTWLVNEWKRKNEELQKLVDEKTSELLNKNRELEIETSLEKVRTIAMGLRKPDDMLDVCKTISVQLLSLGVKEIRNVQTAIFYQQRSTYMNYEYYAKHNKTFITETVYTNNKIHNEFATKMLKGKGETFITHIKGDEVKNWIAYQKTTNVFIDKYLETASSLNYYWFSLGPVALGISTYHPLADDEINLFHRFLKVFELAYQRYLDIEKAEAQAREAQIEASLERVRAVAMSMNKPDDLLSICEVSFKEFKRLGFENIRNAIIHIPNDQQKYFMDYDFSEFTGEAITKIEYGSHPIVDDYLEKIRSAKDAYFEVVIEKDQLEGWKDFRKKSGQKDDPRLDEATAIYYYVFSIGVGDIGISTFKPIEDSQKKILKRFRNVFDLAYRRHNDIALAEEQAREAKIEAALEKVRAVAMSMNKPDDLLNISEVLFKEFQKLDFGELRNAMINIHNDDKKTFLNYDYSDEIGQSVTLLNYNSHPVMEKQINQSRLANDAFSEAVYKGEDLEAWKEFRRKYGEKDDPRINSINALYYYFYSIGNGTIGISTFNPIDEEKLELLKRFRNVFSLSYQRYTDIALAEAQAREAQIELALERVRARTMGMQKSDELKEVIKIVFQQLTHLKINLDHAGFVVDYKPKGDWHFWIADERDIPSKITHPYFESVWANQFNEAKEKGLGFFTTNLNFEEKNKFYNELLSYVPGLPQASKDFYLSCPGLAATTVLMENVGLYIENFSGTPYSDEENATLMRFGKVFQQTYTRFLDLQKAEAQAREAEIELALERVRARTMAMQKSDELQDAAILLFQQMKTLGVQTGSCGFNIWNKDGKAVNVWMSSAEGGFQTPFTLPHTESAIYKKVYEAMKNGETFLVKEVGGNDLKKHFDYLLTLPGIGYVIQKLRETGYSFPETIVYHFAFFNQGYLSFHLHEHHTETHDIFKRFAKVFEQTYTRFLDLQKAEAQAREAEIEVALEKVRSRSLAMHKTEELGEVVTVVVEKLRELNIPVSDGVAIVTHIEGSKDQIEWMENPGFPSAIKFYQSYFEHPILVDYWKARSEGIDFIAPRYTAEISQSFLNHIFEFGDYKNTPQEVKDYCLAAKTYSYSAAFQKNSSIFINDYSGRSLTEQEIDIVKRFSKVFEQAYVRFLDLQKAEAQAREAQIEAALERVRSRTMGMQKSEELGEVSHVMNEQLQQLNFKNYVAGFIMDYKDSDDFEVWRSDPSQLLLSKTHIPYFDHPVFHEFIKVKEKGLDFNTLRLTFEEKNKWVDYALPHFPPVPDEMKSVLYSGAGYAISCAYMKDVGVFIENFEGIPFSDEENSILKRFGKVFEQTYTRFLDLQKAEAQAREAKIEASLERVRSKAMAMHSPNDLSETVNVFFKELKTLGIIPIRCGVGQIDGATRTTSLTTTTSSQQGESFQVIGKVKQTGHPVLDGIFDHWKLQKEYHPVLEGENIKAYYNVMNPQIGYPEYPEGVTQYGNNFFFKEGFVFAWTENLLSEEELIIFRRFTSVLSLTYRRYMDLKEAEEKNKIIQADNDRKTKELEDARQLQLSMLPKELPQLPYLDIAVHMRTATEVGGDYYDFNVDADGSLTVLVGDATGHGMMSGMMVSIMKSFFISNRNNIELKQFFENANNSIKDMHLGRLMMASMGVQITSEKVIATNAGMPSLLYFRNKSKKAGEFVSNNLPLGGMKGTKYLLKEIRYEKGDTLLLMSDGFAELKNEKSEQYGYTRVKEEFMSVAQKSPNEIVEHLKNSASQWIKEIEPDDDVTFVVIKVK
jgi:hypothetical protein